LHAPLYAAIVQEEFSAADLDVTFLPPAARDERLARLRNGDVDVALLDLASLVDTVTVEPGFPARCVLVLTQRLPMAVHFTAPAGLSLPLAPPDLAGTRYGAPPGSRFVAEHETLLRRLDTQGSTPVELAYDELFAALAAGSIDVAPDYGGIAPRYARALGPGRQAATLRYRDCGVQAYGVGFVATETAMRRRQPELAAFLAVVERAYERMRAEPEAVTAAARHLLDLDPAYTLQEWREEEEPAMFGYDAASDGLGAVRERLWQETVAWRGEVTGATARPGPDRLFAPAPRSH
jgi:NitT/TauT family transport system substrate-binding protein